MIPTVRAVTRDAASPDVEIQGGGLDVGENRHAARQHHRLAGGVEGEGGHDHLVTGAQPQGAQRDHQRVRAVGDAHRTPRAEVARPFLLEGLDRRTQDE